MAGWGTPLLRRASGSHSGGTAGRKGEPANESEGEGEVSVNEAEDPFQQG